MALTIQTALKRPSDMRYFSFLAASPSTSTSTPSTKRCGTALHSQRLPNNVSPSKRSYHSAHAKKSNSPSFTSSSSNFSFSNDTTHRVFQPQSCKQSTTKPQRFFSAVAPSYTRLQGLDTHAVPAEDDGHPLAVYTIEENDTDNDNIEQQKQQRTPVLLLHGRTWSSVPVYHLTGNNDTTETSEGGENRSLIQAIYNSKHIQPYAMDFRGFGGTPKDESGFVEPLRCVSDVVSVLKWIHKKHNNEGSGDNKPALLGWSHGALIAQITAQRHSEALSKLILYGSMYNPNMKYPIPPHGNLHTGHTDHEDFPLREMAARNEYDGAMEDFTNVSNEARIFPPLSAKLFAEAALASDPIKVKWWNLHQLNECHPSLVKVPTMVIAGDQDPYATMQTQAELFTNLGRGVDRVWSIIANGDHAVHLSDERHRLAENINNFLETPV